jgi:hypothetical protein
MNKEPVTLAFWRGMGFGLCISGCIWIAAFGAFRLIAMGGAWFAFKGVFGV